MFQRRPEPDEFEDLRLNPVTSLVRFALSAPVKPPAILRLKCLPERSRLEAWTTYRRLSVLFTYLPAEMPPRAFFWELAILVLVYFHPQFDQRAWQRHSEHTFRAHRPLVTYLANLGNQLLHTWSRFLPITTQLHQVRASEERFTQGDDRALFDSTNSPWIASDLVQNYKMPPGKALARSLRRARAFSC
jgi:hypothetical protein